jgi:hypothetical protein
MIYTQATQRYKKFNYMNYSLLKEACAANGAAQGWLPPLNQFHEKIMIRKISMPYAYTLRLF